MAMNRIREINLERLKHDLDKLTKDYNDVANKKRRESNPQEQNNFQSQLDDIAEQMEASEQKINQLEQKEENDQRDKLIKILEDSFDEERDNILNAYKISLPNRSIDC
jgi:transcriptional regulator with XRE-family HTH domain